MLGSQGSSGLDNNEVGIGRKVKYDKVPAKKVSLYNRLLSSTLGILIRNDYSSRNPGDWSGAEPLIRLTPPAYTDTYNSAAGQDRPNPRTISNTVLDQPAETKINNAENLSDMFWLWGQYLDHDMDLSLTNEAEPLNISIPSGDPDFDPGSTGTVELTFHRTQKEAGTGVLGTPRQQITNITPEIDASNVYGSTTDRANWLRLFKDGKLKTSPGDILPVSETIDNDGAAGRAPFVAGDIRANENVALLSMHNMWVREHNWWAKKIKARKPSLTDEQIYQKARLMVESEIQAITFNEFLPLLLGEGEIPDYAGYDNGVDTMISNEFSTVAYRLGHSLISDKILRLDKNGEEIPEGHLTLKDAFFSPENFANAGSIDYVLHGVCKQVCQKLDSKMVESLRNFLFGQPGAGGLDLACLNIQRGRDHGIPDYNTLRVALGLTAKANFNEITSDSAVATALSTAYGGDISKVDPWVGGLAEDHVAGSQLGELFHTIVKDQFIRSRNGDEMWYEHRLSKTPKRLCNLTKLSTIIKRNTSIGSKNIQNNVMVYNE